MFIAEIHDKFGRRIFQGQPFESREDAARYAFRTCQNARQCSTSGAYRDPSGNWRSNGMDIRWHRREDYWREPAKPCDIGLFGNGPNQRDLF